MSVTFGNFRRLSALDASSTAALANDAVEPGDVLVCYVMWDSDATISPDDPAWDLIDSATFDGSSYAVLVRPVSAPWGDVDPAVTFHFSGAVISSGDIILLQGCGTAVSFASATAPAAGAVAEIDAPSVDAATDGLLLGLWCLANNDSSLIQPGDMTYIDNVGNEPTQTLTAYREIAEDGATGIETAMSDPAEDAARAGTLLALVPAPVVVVPPVSYRTTATRFNSAIPDRATSQTKVYSPRMD